MSFDLLKLFCISTLIFLLELERWLSIWESLLVFHSSSVPSAHVGQLTIGCNSSSSELPFSDISTHVHIILKSILDSFYCIILKFTNIFLFFFLLEFCNVIELVLHCRHYLVSEFQQPRMFFAFLTSELFYLIFPLDFWNIKYNFGSFSRWLLIVCVNTISLTIVLLIFFVHFGFFALVSL